jgi:prepilin-type N-terminal cleavage/methylation domain-containing protein
MKRAFTFLELIIVIVILGIVTTISMEIIQKSIKDYLIQKEMNKLTVDLDNILDIMTIQLEHRIKNSVIASEMDKDGNPTGNYISLSDLSNKNKGKYTVLEFLTYSPYSRIGVYKDGTYYPGWSSFVDLKRTNVYMNDQYDIYTPDSNFTLVQNIDGKLFKRWGVNGYNDVFGNKLDVLIFGGSNGRGAINTIYNSYGWYGSNADKVFKIKKLTDSKINIKALTTTNLTNVYEGYFISNGATAFVPLKSGNKYKLILKTNYFPWNGDTYKDGNKTVLADNVTNFNFKKESNGIRIYLCLTSNIVELNDYNLTLCKERIIF